MLQARGLSYQRAGQQILAGVNIDVAAGQSLAVVGPSGSGKTSLLGILAGLSAPTDGTVLVDGKTLTRFAGTARGVSLVLQGYGLVSLLTAAENIEVALRAAGRPARTASHWQHLSSLACSRTPTSSCTSSPAASSSARQSPGRWLWSRGCSSPTSRPPSWTRPPGSSLSPGCSRSPSPAAHWCSLPMIQRLLSDVIRYSTCPSRPASDRNHLAWPRAPDSQGLARSALEDDPSGGASRCRTFAPGTGHHRDLAAGAQVPPSGPDLGGVCRWPSLGTPGPHAWNTSSRTGPDIATG